MQAVQRFFSWWSGTFKKQGVVGKVAFGCFSLFMLCCLCSVPIGLLNSSKSTPEVTKTVVVEVSPSPISESVIPTETTVVAVSPTEKITAFLPGLKPADVTVNLEQHGFTCSSVEQGQLYYVRTCNKDTADYSLHVEIYGREVFSVDFIDSTVLQYATPDNDFAASFLGFMATMPYDGAVQDESRSWVETTLPTLKGQGDVREKVFADVTYRLFGIPTAITLEMGNLP